MSGWIESAGVAMQAVGALVTAAQVALFGISDREHAARAAPGDRLAAWLAQLSRPEERATVVAGMKVSPSLGVRMLYYVGFAALIGLSLVLAVVMTGVGWLLVYLMYQILGPVLAPLEDWMDASLPGGTRVLGGWVLGAGLLIALVRMAGLVVRGIWLLLVDLGGSRLLRIVLWMGRHLETTLRWAALLFGLGAVMEFASRF